MAAGPDDLTAAEREALRLVAENHTSKEIARVLGISASAVNQRIDGARQKLGGVSRLEAARRLRRVEACDPLPGELITVVAPPSANVAEGQQPRALRLEDQRSVFVHDAPIVREDDDKGTADDLRSLFHTLRAGALFALLMLAVLLVAITVMRTANDLGRPLLPLIR